MSFTAAYSTTCFARADTVLIAETGASAIKLAQQGRKPHLILLDVRLPDISGLEVARVLKWRRVAPVLRSPGPADSTRYPRQQPDFSVFP